MLYHVIYIKGITESETKNIWSLKGCLEDNWSNPSSQAKPPTASCSGPCPDDFWIPPRWETPWPLSATCSSAQSPSRWKRISLSPEEPPVFQFMPVASGPVTKW